MFSRKIFLKESYRPHPLETDFILPVCDRQFCFCFYHIFMCMMEQAADNLYIRVYHSRSREILSKFVRKTCDPFRNLLSNPMFSIVTCPCNVYPLEPHFYIIKTGVWRGIPIFLIFAPKHKL